jgi:6-phosphogluconate dehydrogenase
MEVGIVGLGRMGKNMARRLARNGHRVVVHNRTTQKAIDLAEEEKKIEVAEPMEELREMLQPPRAVWVMVPHGDPVDKMVDGLLDVLEPDDVIVDGGNSRYQNTLKRAERIAARDMHFLDVGMSGGIWGLENGYGMMVGGDEEICDRLRPLFETLAPGPDKGWGRVGSNGAGHFVKMVHNGIEYGMMQAYAEGFEIMREKEIFDLDMHLIADIWRFGTVIRSWLLDLTADALAENPDLSDIEGWVDDSGEGRWTVEESIHLAVPAPVISLALQMRFVSRQEQSYAARLLAALRKGFGGHAIKHLDSES